MIIAIAHPAPSVTPCALTQPLMILRDPARWAHKPRLVRMATLIAASAMGTPTRQTPQQRKTGAK